MPQPRILSAEPLTQTIAVVQGTVAHYANKVRFRMSEAGFEAFGKPESANCRYLGNDSWEIARTYALKAAKFRKDKVGNAYIYDTSGIKDEPTFGATPAEFVVQDGQILVALKGDRRPVAKQVSAVKPHQLPVAPASAPIVAPEPAPIQITETTVTDRLRQCLAEIRALEAQTVYRLKKTVDGEWLFSAPTIK